MPQTLPAPPKSPALFRSQNACAMARCVGQSGEGCRIELRTEGRATAQNVPEQGANSGNSAEDKGGDLTCMEGEDARSQLGCVVASASDLKYCVFALV